MNQYVSKPFEYLENIIGVEMNFNKVLYSPELLRDMSEILSEIEVLTDKLKSLENGLNL